jgi:hypothetical protein
MCLWDSLNEELKSVKVFYIALEKRYSLMQSIFKDDLLWTSLFEVFPRLAAKLTA